MLTLGHLFRQALFAYEMGDASIRCQIENFWYKLVLTNRIPLLESNSNIANFVNLGFCNTPFTLSGVGCDILLTAALTSLRLVIEREQPGVIAYLLSSNVEQSMADCISAVLAIAMRLDTIGVSYFDFIVAPVMLQAIHSIDLKA